MSYPQYKNIQEIIDWLNSKENEGDKGWTDTGEYFGLYKVHITHQIRNDLNTSLITRVFLNEKTGELRTFLAKSIKDIPEKDKNILG